MKSAAAQDLLRRGYERGTDRTRGVPTPLLRLSASRHAETGIGDVRHSPVVPRGAEDDLQDPTTGDFYFLPGYSSIGGGDVLR